MPATRSSTQAPVLKITNLWKAFPGTQALKGVDFELRRGEVHALVGQNGSGKSTLIKVLAGFHNADEGTIELDGQAVAPTDTAASNELGLRFVHQDLALVPALNTTENLALGQEMETGFAGRIHWGREHRRARQRMQELGYDFDVRRPVAELGAAERTGIAIARALDGWERARVLVVDEPTASLPRHEVKLLFSAIARVRARGLGVIYVSHRLDEIFEIADRVTVLRDGRRVATSAVHDLDEAKLVHQMVGDIDLAAHESRLRHTEKSRALIARSLCGVVVDNVDLDADAGEVLGVAGLTGSGREEILQLVFGHSTRDGDVIANGTLVRPCRPPEAMRAGVAYVPADRRGQGSIETMSVQENCTLTELQRHTRSAFRLSRAAESDEVKGWITQLDVRPDDPHAVFATLSGGNQQKVVIAKWLRTNPAVLLLDEPTQGVDVASKAVIHHLARNAADKGAAVVIASSDENELCDVCDRVIVLKDGRVAAELSGTSLTPHAIALAQLGGPVPTQDAA